MSGGSQCRCESGNDCASGPRKNREGAFRMDEGIEIHSHVVKQHFWTHSDPGYSVHDAVAVARHSRHLRSLTSDCTSTYLIEFHFAYLEVLPTSISTHRRVTLTLYRP